MNHTHTSTFRGRLAVLVSVLALAVLGVGSTAYAALSAVSVSSQSGTVTYGTAGAATFTVTVTRTSGTPNNPSMSVIGLPSGVTYSFGTPSNWSPASGTGTRTYPLTITVPATVGAGTYGFTARAAQGQNVATGTGSLVVAKAAQTITFTQADVTFGDPDFSLVATASSGLPVTFTRDAGQCDLTGATVHLTGAGSCTVTASQAGNANYQPAPSVQQTFQIAKAAQTITFDPVADHPVYDSFQATAIASSGLPIAWSATGSCAVDASTGVVQVGATTGACTVTASQAGDTNYQAAASVDRTFQATALTAATQIDLHAETGTTSLAGTSVPVWGYGLADAPVSAPGGPTLTVTQGDTVAIVLHNHLAEATSLVVRGASTPTDLTGAPAGGTDVVTFTASEAGTFLYEAGVLDNGGHQVAMGLYGALVVNPSSGTPYGSDAQAVVLVSEVDPALNNAADKAAFDMRNFAPKWELLNGTVFPATPSLATVAPGQHLLLRYVNAGTNYHSMGVLGADQRVVADDGHALAQPYTVVAQTVGPGQTFDAVVGVSATAADATKLAVYDASLQLNNRNRRPATATATASYGGAMAFVDVSGTPSTGDTRGPIASNLAATTTGVSATISDVTTGGSNIQAAEYFVDTAGAVGSGTPMTGAYTSPTESVSATFGTPLSSGTHVVYVRGQDAAGNWGPLASTSVTSDTAGPVVSGLSLTPNPSNGTVAVALHATASDSTTGGANVVAGEYTVDGGAATAMTVNNAAVTVSLDATIPAGLTGGAHTVSVRAQDALGNWGAPQTIDLVVTTSGPVTSSVSAAPNPTNGAIGVNSSTPAVRITATTTDSTSTVVAAEGFIGAVGADGTGFPFVPSDGAWSSTTEAIQADIPLTTIQSLPDGGHTITVHAKNAAGVWGPTDTVVLVVDRTAPTVTGLTLNPNTIAPATASVQLTVAAADATTNVVGGQYWVDGSATPPATPTPFPASPVTIGTASLAAGSHTVYVRVQDAAGNWSAVSSVPLYVAQAVDDARAITANGSTTQTSDANAAAGVLTNDEPTGVAGRTARLTTALARTSGTGAGTLVLSCPTSLGTAATPAVGGQTICTNGAYRVTLNGVGNNNNQRAASKRGTFQFTYTMTLNGVTSTATVTITVN